MTQARKDRDAARSPHNLSALLIIDMINDLAFEGGAALQSQAEALAETVLRLRAEADRLGLPVIYVNDNYGEWRSERAHIVERCARPGRPGRRLVELMTPRDTDYFVIKPHVSGFYATNLPVLLPRLGVSRLVLTGIAADICVLFTAADAHMRSYDLWTPSDAVVGRSEERRQWALDIMHDSLGAEIRPTTDLGLSDWAGASVRT